MKLIKAKDRITTVYGVGFISGFLENLIFGSLLKRFSMKDFGSVSVNRSAEGQWVQLNHL